MSKRVDIGIQHKRKYLYLYKTVTELVKIPSTTKGKTELQNPIRQSHCNETETFSELGQKELSQDVIDCDSLFSEDTDLLL